MSVIYATEECFMIPGDKANLFYRLDRRYNRYADAPSLMSRPCCKPIAKSTPAD